jgi:predicted metal-dependent hydrolase
VSEGAPRRIELRGRAVSYVLRHSRRKSLGIRIDQRGVRVAAPLRMPQRLIDAFLDQHGDWVLRTLDDWASRPVAPSLSLADGSQVPVLGAPWRIEVLAGRRGVRWLEPAAGAPVLQLGVPAGRSVHRAALAALEARALEDFSARVARHADRIGRVAPPVRLTRARTRWGSCSARAIRLHWRLIHLEPALIDYVVAHEVAHLVHMNHSPAFWAVVEELHPGAGEARRRLREAGAALPRLIEPTEPTPA